MSPARAAAPAASAPTPRPEPDAALLEVAELCTAAAYIPDEAAQAPLLIQARRLLGVGRPAADVSVNELRLQQHEDGMPVARIARAEKISPGAVKQSLRRARRTREENGYG